MEKKLIFLFKKTKQSALGWSALHLPTTDATYTLFVPLFGQLAPRRVCSLKRFPMTILSPLSALSRMAYIEFYSTIELRSNLTSNFLKPYALFDKLKWRLKLISKLVKRTALWNAPKSENMRCCCCLLGLRIFRSSERSDIGSNAGGIIPSLRRFAGLLEGRSNSPLNGCFEANVRLVNGSMEIGSLIYRKSIN